MPGPAAGSNEQNTTVMENSLENGSQDSDSEANYFQLCLDLLGISKQNLINNINKEPASIDESGLEFKETEIRVWFNWDTNTVKF